MNAKKAEPASTEALFSALRDKALELGLSPFELAGRLQMAYAYWSALNKGSKSMLGLASAGLDSALELLRAPASQVAALAGIVLPEQFIKAASVEDQLALALNRMRDDPVWGQFAPSDDEWKQTPTKVKIALALVYEQLFQRTLIERAHEHPEPPAPVRRHKGASGKAGSKGSPSKR